MRVERGGIPINEHSDLEKISDRTTRILVQYFLDRHSNQFYIEYEPHEFVLPNIEGLERRTTPDIHLVQRVQNRTNRDIYVETTLAFRNEVKSSRGAVICDGADFKSRQREVMQHEKDATYLVYYHEELEKIHRNYPEYNFFDIPNFKAHLNGIEPIKISATES